MTDRDARRLIQIERLYHEALECHPKARAAFLDAACGDDDALRQEVASLLRLERSADAFLERPALLEAADELVASAAGALVGRRLGGYAIGDLLGRGGMGEVYRGRDLRLGRDAAIKVIELSIAADPAYCERFEEEARAASMLNHPNIVTIYGVGGEDDIAFIAMELGAWADAPRAHGGRPAGHRRGHRPRSPNGCRAGRRPRARRRPQGFEAGKRDAHGRGPRQYSRLRHRSTRELSRSPAPDGRRRTVRLPTEAGSIVGTVGYMSPEQASGRPATQASD